MSWLRFLSTASLFLTGVQASADPPARPNVLWICADDHAAYVYGAYGNRQVRTPHLDRLAAMGMRFDLAYCNSPLCTASRQSFLTGRYPRTIGVTQLRTPLPESETTLAELLAAAGYDTAAIGKMHFNSNLAHGFRLRLDMPQYQQELKRRGRQPLPPGIETLPAWRPFRDPAAVWLNSFCRPYPATDEDMIGTFFAKQAVKYLEQAHPQPFFLMVSFYEPHAPFHFPIEYRGRHRPEAFTIPRPGPEDDWQIPAIFRELSERDKQGITAAYYTSVEFLDRNVGLVLDALERSGRSQDTIVIYTGDHGYLLGQHGRFEKHCSYEPAVRVPLVLRYPQRIRPGTTSALVELVDLVPTILGFCGQSVPPNVQGRSLLPLHDGTARSHRDYTIVEYAENEEALIRTQRWKLVYMTGKRQRQDGYATGRPLPGRTILLFDMEQDPDEQTNLAQQPAQAGLVAELIGRLARHMKQTARQPELIPATEDPHVLLDFCLQSRDVP